MHRWSLRLVGLVITASVLLLPAVLALDTSATSTGPDPVRISDYDATFSISEDGTLQATERLTTEFPSGRHGIFRYWDVQDPADSSVRLIPKDIDVTLDGEPEPFDLSSSAGWRFRSAKIGDADVYVSAGTHVYTISYRIEGALAPTDVGQGAFSSSSWTDEQPASSVFYWNVVAPGWGMAIDQATVTIDLPVNSGLVQCTTGYGSLDSPGGECDIAGGGTQQVIVQTGQLGPRTPVTVRIGQATPLPDRQTLPWPSEFDQSFGRHLPIAVVLTILALAALLIAYRWERASREEEPGFGVAYDPPPGLSPVQTAYVMTEQVPDKAAGRHLALPGRTGPRDAAAGRQRVDRHRSWRRTGMGHN